MVNCFKTMRIFAWGGDITEPKLLYQMYDESGSRINQSFTGNEKEMGNDEQAIKEIP